MKISRIVNLFGLTVLAAGFISISSAAVTPTRVGPVSQYGQLQAGKNSDGHGRIYGSCPSYSTSGNEVQVKGMSLYWSSAEAAATDFYTETAINTMVKDMKIEIVRFAMGVSESWDYGRGYLTGGADKQKKMLKAVVEAAVKNDIYVIIDWHSHQADNQTSDAVSFFSWAAETYGQYDNVIFEVYNEPTNISWSSIKTYADQVVSAIRQHSDNLILVGTPSWDQKPQEAIGNEVNDPKKNVAYTLHYYANTHCWEGNYSWGGGCEGTNGEKAMKAGLSVFVSEWGTGNADGSGTPDENRNAQWQKYINDHKLSWANWSASRIGEGTAAFEGGSNASSLTYTKSGSLVKGYLASNPSSYKACSATPASSSSSVASSSSSVPSSSSVKRVTVFELTSGNANQTVIAGDSINPIVYRYNDNVTGLKLSGLPTGFAGVLDSSARTYSIKGASEESLRDHEFTYTVAVTGVDSNTTATGKITIKHKPVTTSIEVVENATQTVVAGDSILPIVFRYQYLDSIAASGLPEGTINLQMDKSTKTITLAGAVKETLRDHEYTLKLDIFGPDNNASATAKVMVVAPKSSSSVESSSSVVSSSSEASSSSEEVSSSSAESSSSVESSSSEISSSSVESSSSQPKSSSSSVASSSSVPESSSSEPESSSSSVEESSSSTNVEVLVVGSVEQFAVPNGKFEEIVFRNVVTAVRNTYNLHFVTMTQSGNEYIVSATTVPDYFRSGEYADTLTINGEKYEIKLTVTEQTTFAAASVTSPVLLTVENRTLYVSGAEMVRLDVFDMQGRPVESFKQVKGSVSLENLRQGNYIVRVRAGSNSLIRRISIK